MIDSKQIKSNLGKTVQALRKAKGLTQEELSEKLNMQPQSITTIETGRAFISSDALANLCNFFEVDPAIFFNKKTDLAGYEELEYIAEIKRMLPNFDSKKLRYIHDIMLVLQR